MEILLHTIALEPARWTPQRVSQPLPELLRAIATEASFTHLEIFEPHLGAAEDAPAIQRALEETKLTPVILSSYVNLNPAALCDAELPSAFAELAERVQRFGFRKVRIFAGPSMTPDDAAGVAKFTARVAQLAEAFPGVEILLETHDGSLADDPKLIVDIVEGLALPQVALLFQPTIFSDRAATLRQFALQKPFIRHLHIQSRRADLSFATLAEGVVPWPEILRALPPKIGASVEFVPSGIGSVEAFDLTRALKQAAAEAAWLRFLACGGA